MEIRQVGFECRTLGGLEVISNPWRQRKSLPKIVMD